TFCLVMAAFFFVTLLYPQRNQASADQLRPPVPRGKYTEDIAVLMPAKRQPVSYADTIINAALTQLRHPQYRLFPLIYSDDPLTARVALTAARVIREWRVTGGSYEQMLAVAASYLAHMPGSDVPLTAAELDQITLAVAKDDLVQVIIYPVELLVEGRLKSKPLKLNYAFNLLKERFSAFTILDAESMAAKDRLIHADQALQDRPDVDIVQYPVQLMPPKLTGSGLKRLGQYLRRWYSWHNLLEYYRTYLGLMPFGADHGFVSLGGNTLIVRTALLEKTSGWPEEPTEDCALGTIAASLFGARTVVYNDPLLATLEETPPTVMELIKQRRRWHHGFLRVLLSGVWRQLPTREERLLAFWTLAGPFMQAVTSVLVVLTLVTMFLVKSPPVFVMIMYAPIAVMVVAVVMQLKQLSDCGKAFGFRAPWHVHLLVTVTQVPYQWLLGVAATWATKRHFDDNLEWHDTARSGDVTRLTASAHPQLAAATN
ncbi:MAG: glycosyltransferase, partial [Pseudomonas sp.]